MVKIGITGGIGSGKSVVATLLSLSGVPVYIADVESKRLTNDSPLIRERLTALFGPDIYTDEGVDKKLLASYIFHDATLLRKVNQIIHPEVNRHFLAWAERQSSPFCAIESAILFESGFDKVVDTCLMVYAPLSLRVQRVVDRDKVSPIEVERRIRNQMSDEEKRERSDYVIYNDNSRALIPQIHAFIEWLKP